MPYNWLMKAREKITIYCDGACSGNQFRDNAGGWGAILKYGDNVKEIYGSELNTSNQRMELTACIRSLEQLKSLKYAVEVYTDSAYLVNAIHKKWYLTWQKNGWRNSRKQPVENRDLWERLLKLISSRKVAFIKVEGHSGDELNERADSLARKGIEETRKATT